MHDAQFTADLAQRIDAAMAVSHEVLRAGTGAGWWPALRRSFVASAAYWFLRLAGITGKY